MHMHGSERDSTVEASVPLLQRLSRIKKKDMIKRKFHKGA